LVVDGDPVDGTTVDGTTVDGLSVDGVSVPADPIDDGVGASVGAGAAESVESEQAVTAAMSTAPASTVQKSAGL
jgi:hypothetical protein